jgi:transposase
MEGSRDQAGRYVAMDVHKAYVMIGGVNRSQEVVLQPRRLRFAQGEVEQWARGNLHSDDRVVIEATSKAWELYDLVHPLVGEVVIADSRLVKLIARAKVKTDAIDTLKLARLLAGGLIPAIWVPPAEVRALRALVKHRMRLVQQRTQARNRLHGLLQRHTFALPQGALFAAEQREYWNSLPLGAEEHLLAMQNLALLDALEPLIQQADQELVHLSNSARWQRQATLLVQLDGIGPLTAMALLAGIGEIGRFACPKALVSYAGLAPGVHDSGQTHRGGRITKEGRREMRYYLIEAAWVAVRHSHHWGEQFRILAGRRGEEKAIVAMARKLLVTIWHVLQKGVVDRHTQEQTITRKFRRWADQCHRQGRDGLSRTQFVAEHLAQLGLGASPPPLALVTESSSVASDPPGEPGG